MSKFNAIPLIKTAGKLLFDIEPEITEIFAIEAAIKANNVWSEFFPVIVEAYRCQKARFTQAFYKQEPYRLAA